MKILTIMSGLRIGGVENILYNYYSNMDREKYKMDFIVHHKELGELEKKFLNYGCKVYHVTPKGDSIVKNYREIKKIIQDGNYDVVHSRMGMESFIPLMAAKHCGVKVRIAHNHVSQIPNSFIQQVIYFVARNLTKHYSNKWMACSEVAANELFGKKALKDGKVKILKNAIDLEKYRYNLSKREEMRNELKLQNNFAIVMVGRFQKVKNHEFMLDVFADILKERPNSKLYFVGIGILEESIKEKVEKMNMKDKVVFLGYRSDVYDVLQAMDAFVFPTISEGFGNVLIEAQASGLKTFTSKEGVPLSTKVTENICYLSLKEPSCMWAKEIIKGCENYTRKDEISGIEQKGFGVKNAAKKFEKIYEESYVEAYNQEN